MSSRLRPILTLVRRELRQAAWLLLVFTALLALPQQGYAQAPAGICDRTPQVRDAILDLIGGGAACGDVTAAQLEAITDTLNLTTQGIANLKTDDFQGLTNLRYLYLGENALTSLPEGVFSGLASLRSIDLQTNALTALPTNVLRDLPNLSGLYLSGNALTTLPEGLFSGLSNLRSVALHRNTLTELPEGLFSGLSNLSSLGLGYNALTTLPEGLFSGLSNLSSLSLGYNALTTLPEGLFSGLSNLSSLRLGNNALTTLPETALSDLTNLETLDLQFNAMTTLPEDVFSSLATLGELDLSFNSLTTLSAAAFNGVPDLHRLDLAYNSLTALPEDVFRGLSNLTSLRLEFNTLTTLPENVFAGLSNLSSLRLSNNVLTALPNGLFSGLSNLSSLRLSNNVLTTLPADVFRGLSNLRELNLDGNSLTMLPADMFRGLANLEQLFLRNNILWTLPEGVFNDLHNLQTLDLSNNVLTKLSGTLLDDLQARVGLDGGFYENPGYIGPGPFDFVRGVATQVQVDLKPVSITGDSSNRIDLVIVSEAYTASEMGKFADDVETVHAGLLAADPFLEYASYFNIWRAGVPSNESGTDDYLPRDTAFDASYINGIIRINAKKVFAALGGTSVARDLVLVLVNSPGHSGTGGQITVVTNGHTENFVNVVLHELGHSLGGLADEYDVSLQFPGPDCAGFDEPIAANVTRETNPSAIKWRHWIDPATPIPTTTSSETTFSEGVPGLYEGARYCKEGIFRPTLTSKMRAVHAPWKQINTEQLIRAYYDYVSPIDAWTPSTRQLTLPQGRSQIFTVTSMSPATHEIQTEWSVDGAPMGNGASFILDTAAMAVGEHFVTVRASDATPMVRSDPFEVLSARRNWTVTIAPMGPGSFSIPNLGGWTTTSNGTETTTQEGYGRIRANVGSTTPSGIAIIGYSPGGVLVAEAGVPASEPVREGRIFAEVNDRVNTGLAIANPNDAPATIDFYFTDTDGARFAEGAYVLDAGRQIADFLNETPFNGGDTVLGTFTFTSSLPIAVIALRGFTNRDGEFLMTTLPVAPLATPLTPFTTDTASTGTVYFPHFADGSGWATQVILVNPTVRTITGTVRFLDQGSATTAAAVRTLEDGRTGSSFEYSIPPNGSYRIVTSNPSGGVSVGSIRAIPDNGHRAPSGLVIFSFTSAGKTVLEAGVPALAAGSAFRVYVESSGTPEQIGSIRTGLAITNAADTANTVTLEVTNLDGTLAAPPAPLTLPPSGQVSRFIDELFDSLPPNFSGVLRVTSTAEVAIVGLRLRYNRRGELKMTTTPPSIETGPPIMADRFFPHIVDSKGWSTRVILFSGTAGQTSSGTLSYFDTAGAPWDLPTTNEDSEGSASPD